MSPDTARALEQMIAVALSVAQSDKRSLETSAPLRDAASALIEARGCVQDYLQDIANR